MRRQPSPSGGDASDQTASHAEVPFCTTLIRESTKSDCKEHRIAIRYVEVNAGEQLGRNQDIRYSISYGMRLFNDNAEALVETTSSKAERRSQRIRQYFTQLSQLPYRRIEMTTSKVMYCKPGAFYADFVTALKGNGIAD